MLLRRARSSAAAYLATQLHRVRASRDARCVYLMARARRASSSLRRGLLQCAQFEPRELHLRRALESETAMPERALRVRRLGRMTYEAAYRIQKEVELAVRERAQPDTLLLVEHPHVITLGRRASESAVLATSEMLSERNVAVLESNRGGKATYHGLGQVVGYPVINLSPEREDVHRYVRDLEEAIIRALADFRIESFPIKGLTGVHTARGKVAAIGVHIARWVTTHGFALNVNTDLSYFDLILPCEGEAVTSMKEILGRNVALGEVEDSLIARFAEVFEMKLEDSLESGVRSLESQAN
jgi:lipoyl(octanoyl) transferase